MKSQRKLVNLRQSSELNKKRYNPMIKNILFDMGGVIFRQNTEEAFRRFREAGINPDEYMGAYGQRGFFLDVETGDIDDVEFCRQMSLAVGKTISWQKAQHCWLGYKIDVPVDRLQTLIELKKKYHICLLSNTNPFIMAHMHSANFSQEGRPIDDYFHSLFCSYEMHAYKPHADIFRQALATDHMLPEECIFLDDSMKNIEAARAVGIHGLHVETNSDWREPLERLLQQLNGKTNQEATIEK